MENKDSEFNATEIASFQLGQQGTHEIELQCTEARLDASTPLKIGDCVSCARSRKVPGVFSASPFHLPKL